MPAEWEPHEATWPPRSAYEGDWPRNVQPIPWVYCDIIRNLARHERVELIVKNAVAARQVRQLLDRANALSKNVRFPRWSTNRAWLRDSGCIFCTYGINSRGAGTPARKSQGHNSGLLALKFRFNAWAKYSNWRRDEKIGSLMARVKIPTPSTGSGQALAANDEARMGHPSHTQEIRPLSAGNRIVLEGGSIDVNGAGTILTTEECLLSKVQERNPHMTRVHYEKAFADYLGAPLTVWLGRGIFGDDTHGHVDDLTRFVAKDTVVTMVEPNSRDVNHAPLRANLRRLQAARDQDGRQLTGVERPLPQPCIFDHSPCPALL